MSVSELRCTNCLAPVHPMTGGIQRCAYCGTTLVVDGGTASASPADGALHLLDCGANKIRVIKVVRQYTGLGLKEAKELVERRPCVVAVNLDAIRLQWFAADLVKAGARPSLGARASAEVVNDGGSLILEGRGSNPILVIKVIIEHTGMGLKEAKKLSEATPCTLARNLDPASATKFRNALIAAGARVR